MNHLLEQCLEPVNHVILNFEDWLMNYDPHIPFVQLSQNFINKIKSKHKTYQTRTTTKTTTTPYSQNTIQTQNTTIMKKQALWSH